MLVDVADDGLPQLDGLLVRGRHPELPIEVVGEGRGRRQRVLDGGELGDLVGGPRPVALVEVVAEERFVVDLVHRVVALGLGLRLAVGLDGGGFDRRGALFRLVLLLLGSGAFEVLFEQRVLGDLLLEHVRELERGHGQQLDRLLERGRQDELLLELRLEGKLLLQSSSLSLSPVENLRRSTLFGRPRSPPTPWEFRSRESFRYSLYRLDR